MYMTSFSAGLLLLVTGVVCQSMPWPNINLTSSMNKFKMTEKIKQQILSHLGMKVRPTSPPVTDRVTIRIIRNVTRSKTEVNEIISFSEPPDKFDDEKIIQFRFDTKGRRLVVKSASLLIRVKQKRRKKHSKNLKRNPLNSKRKSNKRRKSRKGTKVSLSVSTVNPEGHPQEDIAAVKSRIKRNKWFKVSLNSTSMQKIVDSSNGTVLLYVQCKGCKRNTHVVLVHSKRRRKRQLKHPVFKNSKSLKLNKGRPFLILHTFVAISEREKRSVGSRCWSRTNRCCKRQLYVNFTEIGWDDWIISPRGFNTAECFGSCQRRNGGTSGNVAECGPTRMRTLRLVYQQTSGVFASSVMPNFIVAKCGCGSRRRTQTGSRDGAS